MARGTADDHIWPLVQSKLNVLNRAGLSKDDFTEADQDRQESRGEKQARITEMFRLLEDEAAEETGEKGDGHDTLKDRSAGTSERESRADCGAASRQSDRGQSQEAAGSTESEEWMSEMDGVGELDEWIDDDDGWDDFPGEGHQPAKKARK